MKLKHSTSKAKDSTTKNQNKLQKKFLKNSSNVLSEKLLNGTDEALKPSNKENSSDISANKKRKRPWRQVIRHRAKRERLIKEIPDSTCDKLEQEDYEENSQSEKNPLVKKKKRSRKKRIKDKNKILVKFNDKNNDEQNKEENDLKRADAKLDAARFRYINEQLYTHPSTSAVQLFKDPKAFEAYHRGYRQQLKKWPSNPLNTILLDLSSLPHGSVIADLGCGEAELAKSLGSNYKVHSFDLVSMNERVIVADMAKLPLLKESVDVCVYCLSLMGTNLAHFFREAHRVLKMNGKIKIVEVSSRFRNIKNFIEALGKMGFQLKRKKELDGGYFTALTLQKIGKFVNKRPLGLHLDPCLYKKR